LGKNYINFDKNRMSGDGVKVAVLDTPILLDKPYIAKKVYITKSKYRKEDNGDYFHGDKILYIIDSFAPEVEIYYAVVADSNGEADIGDLIKGLEWCIANNVDIINISITFPNLAKNEKIDNLLEEAYSKGIIIVAASGNSNESNVLYPASSPYVFAIGAIDASGNRWFKSNYGEDISFAMPGANIRVSENSYDSGTSYATALMTTTIARLLEEKPNYIISDIYNKLKEMSDQLDKSIYKGHGTPKFQN
jgi:subtilisin